MQLPAQNPAAFCCLLLSVLCLGSARVQRVETGPAPWDLTPVLIPGASNFTMTIYGAPSDPPTLKAMVSFMQRERIGQGFDPGPAYTLENAAILKESGFTFTSFYPGADFEVPDGSGPYQFPNATVEGMRELSQNMFVTVSFGEYGYFFHCLREANSIGWWHTVYPNATDFARHEHEITPKDLSGYRTMPQSHKEAYEAVTAYVMERRRDYLGLMTQMLTGYGHYTEMYGAKWGTKMISLEVGESIINTQSKYAFARGSSRRFKIPWSAQVSPWHGPSCTSRGPVQFSGGTWVGQAAGHSTSFYYRMFLHAWFAGAAMLTPENSGSYFFEIPPNATHDGKLSDHGIMAQGVHKMIASHDRGTPYIPVVVVVDEASGYSRIPCNYGASAWGIFTGNAQATETAHLNDTEVPVSILVDLFEGQIWPAKGRGSVLETIEEAQLRPTPYGELIDVAMSDSPGDYLAAYRVILLAGGDIDFKPSLADQLLVALKSPSAPRLLLHQYHVAALQIIGKWDALNATGRVDVLDLWINPETSTGTAISNERLATLSEELLPFAVSANVSVQFQVNRRETKKSAWILELLNNDGITKPINTTATVDISKTSLIEVKPNFSFQKVLSWGEESDVQIGGPGDSNATVRVILPPGGIMHLEFPIATP